MKKMIEKNWRLLISGIAAVAVCVVFGHRGATAQSAPPPNGQTAAIVAAADALLNSLDAAQREKVQFPFSHPKRVRLPRPSAGAVLAGVLAVEARREVPEVGEVVAVPVVMRDGVAGRAAVSPASSASSTVSLSGPTIR
jgi:hypothetical protein